MRFLGRFALLVVAALVAPGCEPPRTTKPLGERAALDQRLAGLWVAQSRDGNVLLYVTPHENGGDLLLVVPEKDGVSALHFDVAPGNVGAVQYLNLRPKRFASAFGGRFDLEPDYIVAKHDLAANGSLTLSWMDEEVPKKAIEDGTLAGSVTEQGIRITDEAAKVLAVIERADPTKVWATLEATFWPVRLDAARRGAK